VHRLEPRGLNDIACDQNCTVNPSPAFCQ
jgi:hypothetical protein